jgi:Flp pilus assembly protein TadG
MMPRLARRRRGAAIVEMSFVVIALFGLLFLLIDLGWVVFAKASVQHAVREGCRFAVTSQTISGMGHLASIQEVVRQNSMGFISPAQAASVVQVRFYNPETLQPVSGAGSNAGGNLVIVAVENFEVRPLIPFVRSADPIRFSVRAADRMEASPMGIPPSL